MSLSIAKTGKNAAKRITQKLAEELKPIEVLADTLGVLPFDREEAFQLYAVLAGDIEKTAHSLGVPATEVLRVSKALAWDDRLRGIIALKNSGSPREVERGINRAMNFVQAHRLRMMVNRVLNRFYAMDDEELYAYCFSTITKRDKEGNETSEKKLNTRPFADLASAMEKAQALSYMALSDTGAERSKREEEKSERSVTDMHASIAEQLAKIRPNDHPQAKLFEEQLVQAAVLQGQKEAQEQLEDEAEGHIGPGPEGRPPARR